MTSLRDPTIVDCVVLSRSDAPLDAKVAAGIAAQRGVRLNVHRVVGRRHEGETRMPAIVRRGTTASNAARARGFCFSTTTWCSPPIAFAPFWTA